MKSAVINFSDIIHKSGRSCMRAARWCEGECEGAREGRCLIYSAGDCTASLPVRTRRITLQADEYNYERAVCLLQNAGFDVK